MHEFLLALIGGALIGLSAVILMATNGRVLGVSGIVAGLLPGSGAQDTTWRIAFVAGVLAAPLISILVLGYTPPVHLDAGPALVIASGLIVGFGTVLGSGCTSGHGVCGLARLSRRSIAATAIFMAVAIATVLVRSTIGG